jgi:hypothetical protein
MTRGVVLRQGPFFVFFLKPRSRAASKSPCRDVKTSRRASSFATLNQRSADLPGEAADCKANETLIDLPEQLPEALDADAIRGGVKLL